MNLRIEAAAEAETREAARWYERQRSGLGIESGEPSAAEQRLRLVGSELPTRQLVGGERLFAVSTRGC